MIRVTHFNTALLKIEKIHLCLGHLSGSTLKGVSLRKLSYPNTLCPPSGHKLQGKCVSELIVRVKRSPTLYVDLKEGLCLLISAFSVPKTSATQLRYRAVHRSKSVKMAHPLCCNNL